MRFSAVSGATATALLFLFHTASASPIHSHTHAGADEGITFAPLSKEGEAVDDHYIVVLKKEVGVQGLMAHLENVQGEALKAPLLTYNPATGEPETGGIKHVYTPNRLGKGWYGYAGAFAPEILSAIRARPEVAYVEHDQVISVRTDIPAEEPSRFTEIFDEDHVEISDKATGETFFRGYEEESLGSDSGIATERGAPWGLARLSHRNPLTLSTFTKYEYALASVDDGVDIYIIDTGVNINHVELEGRAKWGKTIPKGASDFDGNGHGSHCAGIAASRKYGVAKGANVIAVKVLGDNGSGTLSDVIAGITWAAEQAADKAEKAARELAQTGKTKYKGSVGSMSLGGGKSQATDDAVNAAVESGMYMSVAAGNDNRDAKDYSPARAAQAICVGATTLGDERAYFSNFGETVSIMAPGLNIRSIWTGGNQTENTISGTSMACPAVSGLIAYYLGAYGSETLPLMTPKQLDDLTKEDVSLDSIIAQYETSDSFLSRVASSAFNLLPTAAQAVLPEPVMAILRPVPPKQPEARNISPKQMKGLIRKLATKGVLSDVKGSPNLLIFNNATIAAPKK